MTEANVTQSRFAVHVLLTLGNVDEEFARVVVVLELLLDVNVNAADRVDDAREALVIHFHEIINRDSREINERLSQQINSAVDVSVIDLVPAPTRNIDSRVARYRGNPQSRVLSVEYSKRDSVRP